MSDARRILMVARHFWPVTTDQTLQLRNLAVDLHAAGYSTEVITPRWNRAWPRTIFVGNAQVHFLDQPPTSLLRRRRYHQVLAEWIESRSNRYDTVYFHQADMDAQFVVERLRTHASQILVRFNPQELNLPSAPGWQPAAASIDACSKAHRVVVADNYARQLLLAKGIVADKIVRIPSHGAARQDVVGKATARKMLAAVNYDLFVRSTDRIVLCPDLLSRDCGTDFVIEALWQLIENERRLRLWIVGDSVERSRIYERLQFYGLHRIVCMPGTFTDVQTLMEASDLVLLPETGRGLGWFVPTCIHLEIPFLTPGSVALQQMAGPASSQLTFERNSKVALLDSIENWFAKPAVALQAIKSARTFRVSQSENRDLGQLFAHSCSLNSKTSIA